MWIRSQDRKNLVIPSAIWISVISNTCVYINTDTDISLGMYKSEERALEILEEIQNKIIDYEIAKCNQNLDYRDVLYVMPIE